MSRYNPFDASTYNPSGGRGTDGISYRNSKVAEAPMQVTIEGGVTQIGNDEYIRKDQLPKIIEQASKAGESRALSKIRNSPATRRRLAI